MGDDISIPLDSMGRLNTALKNAVIEFEDADANQQAVQDAIGSPLGRHGLRRAADDFEGDWDDKRETLRRKLVELQERVERTEHAWEALDRDLARKLESEAAR